MPTFGEVKIKTDWREFYQFRAELKKQLTEKGLYPNSQKFNWVLSQKMKKKFGHN